MVFGVGSLFVCLCVYVWAESIDSLNLFSLTLFLEERHLPTPPSYLLQITSFVSILKQEPTLY